MQVIVVHVSSDENYGIETVAGLYFGQTLADEKFDELVKKHTDEFHDVKEIEPWGGYERMATDENDVTVAIKVWDVMGTNDTREVLANTLSLMQLHAENWSWLLNYVLDEEDGVNDIDMMEFRQKIIERSEYATTIIGAAVAETANSVKKEEKEED